MCSISRIPREHRRDAALRPSVTQRHVITRGSATLGHQSHKSQDTMISRDIIKSRSITRTHSICPARSQHILYVSELVGYDKNMLEFFFLFPFPHTDLEMPSGHFRRAWSTDKDLDLQNSKLYIWSVWAAFFCFETGSWFPSFGFRFLYINKRKQDRLLPRKPTPKRGWTYEPPMPESLHRNSPQMCSQYDRYI